MERTIKREDYWKYKENMDIILDVAKKYRKEIMEKWLEKYDQSISLIKELNLEEELEGLVLPKEEVVKFLEFMPESYLDVFELSLIIHAASQPAYVDIYRKVRDGELPLESLFDSILNYL